MPYLNRFQKYADKSYTQQEYESAERTIFEDMDFNLQITTFVTFLNFYLTNGIAFVSDSLCYSKIKIIEDEILGKAKDMVKNGSFLGYEPEKLALSIIK